MRITDATCVSAPELARVLGVTRRRVDQLAAAGTLPKVDGRFPLVDGVRAYLEAKARGESASSLEAERERVRILTARRKLLEHEVADLQRLTADPRQLLTPTFEIIGRYMGKLWSDVSNVWPAMLFDTTPDRYRAQEFLQGRLWPLWDDFARELEEVAPEPHRAAMRAARAAEDEAQAQLVAEDAARAARRRTGHPGPQIEGTP